ncbi:MAG: hypothetical protein GXY47_14630, partial [Acidobacteria bacterium]|nr:hypothetical protein [Acidobacteriota bacterium]
MQTRLIDTEAVSVVLGAVLVRGADALGDVIAAGLEPRHLPDERDRITYRAMLSLATTGTSIDLVTMQKEIMEAGQADAVPITYLSQLGAGIPVDIDVTHHARELVRIAGERELLNKAHNLHEAAKSGNGTFPDAINDLEGALIAYRSHSSAGQHLFEAITEDRYRLSLPEIGSVLEVDRLRREHNELLAELCVRCRLPGAKSFGGTLSIADFNLSSGRARTERAKLLASRAGSKSVDWTAALEELCQRVLTAERQGQPAVDLRTLERPAPDDSIRIDGLSLPRRHPAVLFGDGGTAKSYLALHILGNMAQRGMRVGLFDWELAGEDHRDRLERLFGPDMPEVVYARCERPLTFEADRLVRIVREQRLEYAVFDSAAFACDGPPESAEV